MYRVPVWSMTTKLLVIVGPTGVGKSALAMRLARAFDGEIVGADSRQVYRHMSIGTAKPSYADRTEIPHHIVDIIEPDQRYSLALFLRHARESIHNAKKVHGRLPLVVGGTGQYIRGLLEGWQVPEVNPNAKLREELESWVESDGVKALFAELRRLDPVVAERVDCRNPRRVIRALEVALSRDDDASPAGGEGQSEPYKIPPDYDPLIIGLTMDRPVLYARIDARIDAQLATGWLDEVRALRERGYGAAHPALSGLGYAELLRHLDGELPLEEAVQRIKYRTHRYVRQQYNWFRLTDKRIRWLTAPVGYAEFGELLDEIQAWLASGIN